MIIHSGSEKIINELNIELKTKTTQYISSRYSKSYTEYVPWMCLPCLTQDVIKDEEIFLFQYEKGQILLESSKLDKVRLFMDGDGSTIWKSGTGVESGISFEQRTQVQIGTNETFEYNSALYNKAVDLIDKYSPFLSSNYHNLVEMVIPLKTPFSGYGFSTHFSRGVIFKKLPKESYSNYIEFALELVHELGHQVLMIYQSADKILDSSLSQPIWSGIRKTNRPAIQAFQGLIALSYMGLLLDKLLASNDLDNETRNFSIGQQNEIIQKSNETIIALKNNCNFTKIGKILFKELEEKIHIISENKVKT